MLLDFLKNLNTGIGSLSQSPLGVLSAQLLAAGGPSETPNNFLGIIGNASNQTRAILEQQKKAAAQLEYMKRSLDLKERKIGFDKDFQDKRLSQSDKHFGMNYDLKKDEMKQNAEYQKRSLGLGYAKLNAQIRSNNLADQNQKELMKFRQQEADRSHDREESKLQYDLDQKDIENKRKEEESTARQDYSNSRAREKNEFLDSVKKFADIKAQDDVNKYMNSPQGKMEQLQLFQKYSASGDREGLARAIQKWRSDLYDRSYTRHQYDLRNSKRVDPMFGGAINNLLNQYGDNKDLQ